MMDAENQRLFMVLTVAVIIIIILTSSPAIAVLAVGLTANYFILCSAGTKTDHFRSRTEHFGSSDPLRWDIQRPARHQGWPGAPPPRFAHLPEGPAEVAPYPGAIDFGQADRMTPGSVDEGAAWMGHRDRSARPFDVPPGNPFDLDRYASPTGAAPCIDDDAIAIADIDELATYQARARNSPERTWEGNYHKKKNMIDRYFREEVDQQENRRWWGAHEV